MQARIDMIGAACESAEKVLADTRKAYCFGTRQGIPIVPTLDKAQAAKIQEQENLLRAAVNFGEGNNYSLPFWNTFCFSMLQFLLTTCLIDFGDRFIHKLYFLGPCSALGSFFFILQSGYCFNFQM